MVDLDALARDARRTSEWGRARMACRIVVVIAALAAVPLLSGARPELCACLAVVLFAAAAFLRWRSRLGVDSVRDGLVLGAVPLAAALVLLGCGVECPPLASSAGALVCSAAGAVAGVGVTWRASRATSARGRRWLLTLVVASMTAAMGCVGLGLGAVLPALLALPLVAALAWIPMVRRAA